MLKFCNTKKSHARSTQDNPMHVPVEQLGPTIECVPYNEAIRKLNSHLQFLAKTMRDTINQQFIKKEEFVDDFLKQICSTCMSGFLTNANALQYTISCFIGDSTQNNIVDMLIPVHEDTLCEMCSDAFKAYMSNVFKEKEEDRTIALAEFCRSINTIPYDNAVERGRTLIPIAQLTNVVNSFLIKAVRIENRFSKFGKKMFPLSEMDANIVEVLSFIHAIVFTLRKLKTLLDLMKLEEIQRDLPKEVQRDLPKGVQRKLPKGVQKKLPRMKYDSKKTLTLNRIPKKKKYRIEASHSFTGSRSESQRALYMIREEEGVSKNFPLQSAKKDFSDRSTCNEYELSFGKESTSLQGARESVTSTSDEASSSNYCTASSQNDVEYDPRSDAVLCKIDEHSIKNYLESELGKDILMRALILEAGSRRQLIDMLSSEVGMEELKIIFPRMFLSQSMDTLNPICPGIVIKEKDQLLNNFFHRGINTTFHAFLDYIRKVYGKSPVQVMPSDIGQVSVAECKNSTLVTQGEKLGGSASVSVESTSEGDYLKMGRRVGLHQSTICQDNSMSSTDEEKHIYEVIDDLALDDAEKHYYESIDGLTLHDGEGYHDKNVSDVTSHYYENGNSFHNVIKQDQAITSRVNGVQDGEKKHHSGPLYEIPNSHVKQDEPIVTVDPRNAKQSVGGVCGEITVQQDILSTSGSSDISLPLNRKQGTEECGLTDEKVPVYDVVVQRSQPVSSTEDKDGVSIKGVNNFVLRNRMSMQVNVSLVKQYIMGANEKDLLTLLVRDAGGIDELIKILVLEIGKEMLMQVFSTISLSDIENSLAKESCDVVVRSGNILLKSDGLGNFVEAHLLKTFISYIRENCENLKLCKKVESELSPEKHAMEKGSVVNYGVSAGSAGEAGSVSTIREENVSPNVSADLRSEHNVSTKPGKSHTTTVVNYGASASRAGEASSVSTIREENVSPNVSADLRSEHNVSTKPGKSHTTTVVNYGASASRAGEAGSVSTIREESVSPDVSSDLRSEHNVSTRLGKSPTTSVVNYGASTSSSSKLEETEYGRVDWDRTIALKKTYLYSNEKAREHFVCDFRDSDLSTSSVDQETVLTMEKRARYFIAIDQVYSHIRNMPTPIDKSTNSGKKIKKSASISVVEPNRNVFSKNEQHVLPVNRRMNFMFWKSYKYIILNTTVLQNFVGSAFDMLYSAINETLRITDNLYFCNGYILLNWIMVCIRDNFDIKKCDDLISKDFKPCIKYYQSITSVPYCKNLPLYVGVLRLNRVLYNAKIIHDLFHKGKTSSDVLCYVSKDIIKAEISKYMKEIKIDDVTLLKQRFQILGSQCISKFALEEFMIKGVLVIPSYVFSDVSDCYELDLSKYNVIIIGNVPSGVTLICGNLTVYGDVNGEIISKINLKIFGSVCSKANIICQSSSASYGVFIKGNIQEHGKVKIGNGVLEVHGDVKGNVEAYDANVIITGSVLGGTITCKRGMYLYVYSMNNESCFHLESIQYVFFCKSVVEILHFKAIDSTIYFRENGKFAFKIGERSFCDIHYCLNKKFREFNIQEFKALMQEKRFKLDGKSESTVNLQDSSGTIQSSLSDLRSIKSVKTGKDVQSVSSRDCKVKIEKLSDLRMI